MKRLRSYSGTNMVYSLLAVLALAFAWWAIMPNPTEPQRRPAEVEQAADYAARTADWPVWSAVGLGESWTPTTVRFGTEEGVADWRQGWVSPEQEYVALQQAVDPPPAWTEPVLTALTSQQPMALDGPGGQHEWAVWTGVSKNDEPTVALVLEPTADQAATTIVHGTADVTEMATFVRSLEVITPTP